jgi:hypothetical protein
MMDRRQGKKGDGEGGGSEAGRWAGWFSRQQRGPAREAAAFMGRRYGCKRMTLGEVRSGHRLRGCAGAAPGAAALRRRRRWGSRGPGRSFLRLRCVLSGPQTQHERPGGVAAAARRAAHRARRRSGLRSATRPRAISILSGQAAAPGSCIPPCSCAVLPQRPRDGRLSVRCHGPWRAQREGCLARRIAAPPETCRRAAAGAAQRRLLRAVLPRVCAALRAAALQQRRFRVGASLLLCL